MAKKCEICAKYIIINFEIIKIIKMLKRIQLVPLSSSAQSSLRHTERNGVESNPLGRWDISRIGIYSPFDESIIIAPFASS